MRAQAGGGSPMSTGTWHVRLRDLPLWVCGSQDGSGADGEASRALDVLRLWLKVAESQGRVPRRAADGACVPSAQEGSSMGTVCGMD